MAKRRAESPSSRTSTSIGELLRAQLGLTNNNHTTSNNNNNNHHVEEKPKTVGFNESENMRLYELYSAKREEYHSTRPSGQRNEEVPMDTLAKEWAAEITSMGFAERTPAQIKQRIRDMRKFSRKHAYKLGLEAQANNNQLDKLGEFSWAETKRRSRGPVPDWMTGLAQIMMQEQEKNQEEIDSASDAMEATYGRKKLKLEKPVITQPTVARSVSRDEREMSPETALLDKKIQLADAKLESERLRQQALKLEIAYYQRQVQLYDEQMVSNDTATNLSEFLNTLASH